MAGSEERLGIKRCIFLGQLTVKTEGDGDVLQERTFPDGQPKRVVDLVLREAGSGRSKRNSTLPDGVDEVKVRL